MILLLANGSLLVVKVDRCPEGGAKQCTLNGIIEWVEPFMITSKKVKVS